MRVVHQLHAHGWWQTNKITADILEHKIRYTFSGEYIVVAVKRTSIEFDTRDSIRIYILFTLPIEVAHSNDNVWRNCTFCGWLVLVN